MLTVVEFFAPWCGHCKKLAPEWETAAGALKSESTPPITLASVDVTTERALGEKYDIKGFPTIKIFEGHDATNAADYEGPREAGGIVSFLKKRAGPASKELNDAKEAEAVKKSEKVIVVNAGEATETWTNLANSMRDTVYWCHTTHKVVMKALGVKAGTISMVKDFDEKNPVYSGTKDDMKGLKEFVDYHRTPVGLHVKKGDQSALKIVFEDENKPNLFLFTTSDDAGLDTFKGAVQGVRGHMVTARFHSSDFPEAFTHFGMDRFMESKEKKKKSELPKVLLEERKSGLRYLMQDAVSDKAIKQFINDYKDGKLEPFLKSEPEPEENSGPVKVVVGTSFERMVRNAGHWVFLEAYAPWCGHCKKLTPIWEDLGAAFSETSGANKVVIAKIDATSNDLPKAYKVEGFPTLLLFKGDGTAPQTYEGKRDFTALSAFVTKQTGATVKAGFQPSQAPEPEGPSWDDMVIHFLQSRFQVPFMPGQTISGLLLAAVIIFLLFVAAVCLVIACMPLPKEAPAPSQGKTDKKD